MSYQLKLLSGIEKQLRRLPRPDRERVVQAMRSLADNPKPAGTTHLVENLYRVRVGSCRVLYAVFEAEVVVLVCKVARRTEVTCKGIRALLKRARDMLGSARGR
ncbi:MAG: type II toxin-antitoxin system RelE/ParE family toxin [Armatimonadetes bacterium]|nr:type II toxin-antitoxin system RelE/ParE family toxin [Armatimonadota bacterium]